MNNRIKEIRNKEKLTLRELSQKIGIASNTLSQYETGKREPKLEMWQALAKSLSVPVPYLQGLGVSRSEAINYVVDKILDENEQDNYFSIFRSITKNLWYELTRDDVNYINSNWGSGLRFSDNFVEDSIDRDSSRYFIENLIDNNNRQALGYLVGKYLPLVNDYNFLASVPSDVDAYYMTIEKKYHDDKLASNFSNMQQILEEYQEEKYKDDLVNLSSNKNKDVVLFESICNLFISDIGVKSALLSYSDDRKIEINKNVQALFNLLTTDTNDKRVLEIRENVKDQLDAYANDNED
ncbi:helix-turn-helix domain-containing protein [Ligilactobacillus sp. UO.C109]|uniref:helix-turn-helix domain-containing protein n=1 Tax=Ligilactobacillus sp. UO.C109 TaxID=3003264 RepID=UPI00228669B4|nr:helix-turn-helix transcriptional regulator [Ligilactobacillus sp. UO.C109]MCZ0744927.1 helix-turn-helix transcriptional regulator [Ligilactobacillus sp. UO.C109]